MVSTVSRLLRAAGEFVPLTPPIWRFYVFTRLICIHALSYSTYSLRRFRFRGDECHCFAFLELKGRLDGVKAQTLNHDFISRDHFWLKVGAVSSARRSNCWAKDKFTNWFFSRDLYSVVFACSTLVSCFVVFYSNLLIASATVVCSEPHGNNSRGENGTEHNGTDVLCSLLCCYCCVAASKLQWKLKPRED